MSVLHAVPANRPVRFRAYRSRRTEKEKSMKMNASAAEHVQIPARYLVSLKSDLNSAVMDYAAESGAVND